MYLVDKGLSTTAEHPQGMAIPYKKTNHTEGNHFKTRTAHFIRKDPNILQFFLNTISNFLVELIYIIIIIKCDK